MNRREFLASMAAGTAAVAGFNALHAVRGADSAYQPLYVGVAWGDEVNDFHVATRGIMVSKGWDGFVGEKKVLDSLPPLKYWGGREHDRLLKAIQASSPRVVVMDDWPYKWLSWSAFRILRKAGIQTYLSRAAELPAESHMEPTPADIKYVGGHSGGSASCRASELVAMARELDLQGATNIGVFPSEGCAG